MFNCRSMRVAVILSALLLGAGLLLGLAAVAAPLSMPYTQLALILVLAGAAVLSAAFVDALLPGADRRLDGCRH
ncbi:MAG: hypothetical protein LJE69_07055 [Thiohalocapsa sp.]|jgi:hypothetical protein|uniref:hypothetical protein n=1 Tax=Thiohalocapsa sp. TaxID=2497641 RepID=UPI0025DC752E|nr:hypothetical protein [Thiohalocapsa sp.]MCG6940992.1 hypothetical protein [Thiohalocapsa sp.]